MQSKNLKRKSGGGVPQEQKSRVCKESLLRGCNLSDVDQGLSRIAGPNSLKSNKLKIWVIGRNYPTPKNKMCGSFELEQAQLLARKGHDVVYITCPFHPLYKVKKWGSVDWQDGGIHVYAYSQLYFPQRFKIYWDSFKSPIWERLLKRVEENEGVPDIIHLHYPTLISVPEPILSFKAKGTKIIATEHLSDVLTGHINVHSRNQLQAYVERVDHFICVGKPLKESVKRLTGTAKNIEVIPNVVPDTFICERQEHKGFNYISVGRLVKGKQFDKLIRAFAKAFSDDKDVSLTIVGGGNQYWRLKKLIDNLGLREQVTLTGVQSRTEVARLMCKADILVSYSRLETFGVTVIEGWYCGLPAIATTAIGFAEYWKESLGELIPFDDESKLIEAMKKVRRVYNAYSVEQIQLFARQCFSEDAVYSRLVNLYNK